MLRAIGNGFKHLCHQTLVKPETKYKTVTVSRETMDRLVTEWWNKEVQEISRKNAEQKSLSHRVSTQPPPKKEKV